MCINFLHIDILTRIVGEGGGDDGVKERGGYAEGAIGREDSESLNVEVVGLLIWRWGGSRGGKRGGGRNARQWNRDGFKATLYASYDLIFNAADGRDR